MRVFVRCEVFDTVFQEKDVAHVRQNFMRHWKEVLEPSGKVELAGAFSDGRAPFFILNVDSGLDLMRLLGPLLETFRIETHPVCGLDELARLFQEIGTRGATGSVLAGSCRVARVASRPGPGLCTSRELAAPHAHGLENTHARQWQSCATPSLRAAP